MRILISISLVAAAACGGSTVKSLPSPSPTAPAKTAVPVPSATATATIHDASGKRVGSATFTDTYTGVLVSGTVSDVGLGPHGIHLHAVGKCEAPFTTAGPHFNPEQKKHGYRNPDGPHLGDMPNIDTPAAGSLKFEVLVPGITLKGTNALLDADGAAIVIHAARDDYATDPSGSSGGRIACGVITGS